MKSIFDIKGPKVFSIEPYQNFLGNLAHVLANEIFIDDLRISDAIILLPTRRAARQLAQEFLKARPQSATILPRIRTLGDIDPEDSNLAGLESFVDFEKTISPLRRQFMLAKLIGAKNQAQNWSSDLISCMGGAEALGELLDSAELMANADDGPDWSKLDDLVDIEMADHFKQSKDFLKIITEYWPQILKENGYTDPANKRRRAIETLTKAWAQNPPDSHVIIAGSTGSIPAARKLMKLVANLPKGCVVLPGLDKNMEARAWARIKNEDSHAQRTLHDTINEIGISRDEVISWPTYEEIDLNLENRRKLLNAALTPKEETADWLKQVEKIGKENAINGLKGLSLIEASSEDLEAAHIAYHMRKSLENEGETCVLVTPNQNIALRVCEKMAFWGVKLDVSSGQVLNKTQLGSFIELVISWLIAPENPKAIMALLAHNFTSFGLDEKSKKLAASSLEIGLLRGAARDNDLNETLKRAQDTDEKSWNYRRANKKQAIDLINQILSAKNNIFAQFTDNNLSNIAYFLCFACEEIAKNEFGKFNHIWSKEAGKNASNFFGNLFDDGQDFEVQDLNQGFKIIKSLMAKSVVRPKGTHPNLAILGPLEARLLHFDKYILAGLDDGIWPQPPNIDPFLSRPMREKLGLQSRDLRLGLSAHDFAQLAANKNVILTRCAKRGGAPSVPSRWIWRLKTLVQGAIQNKSPEEVLHNNEFNNHALLNFIRPKYDFNIKKIIPNPKPPIELRPKEFAATQIESLIRDPYKIYVTKILGLNPLDALGSEISSKERGSAIHKALEILKDWNENIPQNAEQILLDEFKIRLLEFGYKDDDIDEEIERLKPSAKLMLDFQNQRLSQKFDIFVEQFVTHELITKSAKIKLKATADRIDIDKNGNAEIWDFKTGEIPSDPSISSMFAAQLPVTQWLLMKTGVLNIKNVSCFGHIKIGNRKPKIHQYEGGQKDKKAPKLQMNEVYEKTDETLNQLFTIFANENMPYKSKPRVQFINKTQTYEDPIDRLARRLEWADAIDGEDEND